MEEDVGTNFWVFYWISGLVGAVIMLSKGGLGGMKPLGTKLFFVGLGVLMLGPVLLLISIFVKGNDQGDDGS